MINIIKYLCPGIAESDFRIQDDGAGPYISAWSWLGPQPTVEQLQAAQPAAEFAAQKAAEFAKFRAEREQFLNRLAGIGLAAQFNGQDAVLASVCAVRVGLLNLTTDAGVLAATDLPGLKLAMKTRYAAILSGVPAEVLSAFKQVDA